MKRLPLLCCFRLAKKAAPVMVFVLMYVAGHAQTINSMAFPKAGSSAVDGATVSHGGSIATVYKIPFEKVFVHTDRDIYLPGDTIWFKAYLLNAQTNVPATTSNNLYAELIDLNAHIISTELIRLDEGFGHGDFWLPDSIPAGNYRLRAYTSWMRNFGDNFIFEKPLQIIRLNHPLVTDKALTTAQKKKPVETGKTATIHPAATVVASPQLRFFPEGGSLVEGVSSIVAVKAEDADGRGIKATGLVLASSGDTVARFNCDTLGMGLFTLLPVSGEHYRASAQLNNKHAINALLPVALTQGLAMQIRQTDSLVRIMVSSGQGMPAAADRPPVMYLVTVKHTGQSLLSQPVQLQGGQATVTIPASLLPEGVSAITLYDEQNKPNCERLVYVHHPGFNQLELQMDKAVYQPNKQATVQLSAAPNSNLSIAVANADLNADDADNMISYLMLSSELKGHIESAGRYFDVNNADRYKQLDLLLLTQGWRDFVWRRLADSALRISYPAEQHIAITGKLRDEVRNKYLPGMHVSLFAPQAKGSTIYSTVTDSTGRFRFDQLLMYGNTSNVKLAALNDKGAKKGAFMVDTLTVPLVKTAPGIIELIDSTDITAVGKRIASDQSKLRKVTQLKEVKIKGSKAIITNDGNANMLYGPVQAFDITAADFEYKTLEWYILQHVKDAMQSNDPDVSGVMFPTLVGVNGHTVMRLRPAILFVNGSQLSMFDSAMAETYRFQLYNTPIQKFKRIVIKKTMSKLEETNLIYLTMVDDAFMDNPGSLSLDVQAYYQARTFYQPANGEAAAQMGYRPTIYWAPDIKTDADGHATLSFYNSSSGVIKVMVQGITASGAPLSKALTYQVK